MRTEANEREQTILNLSGVSLGYRGVVVLSEIRFKVNKGEFVGIVGPNGSGKSTLLKGILGLIPPLEGEITVIGCSKHKISPARRKIGYMPQKSKGETKFPATVAEVVLMGLYAQIGWLRRPGQVHWQKAYETLALVGMESHAARPIGELSSGQQQRVLIARALISEPELLILDEPTAAVDMYARRSILETIERLNKVKGITVLMVSHDINEIVHSCDKVLLVNGNMAGYGTPKEVLTLENLRTVYGDGVFVYDHHGHPHILVGDFDA